MPTFKRLVIPRAYQAVHEALEQEILSGRIVPGEPLPTETELAAQFGVTRHTVREGMRVLEQSGLVKRDAGRRLHATLPRYDQLASRGSRALLMQRVSFRELWEVAMPIEACAIDLAMAHVDDALIDRLEQNLAEMATAVANGSSITTLDVAFHNIIAEAGRNRVLLLSREPVSLLFYPSLEKLFAHPRTRDVSPRRLYDAHCHIVGAMRDRDARTAHDWMCRHLADFRRGYEFAGIDLDSPAEMMLP